MNTEQLIPTEIFCLHHNVEVNLVYSFQEMGLVELVTIEQKQYLDAEHLPILEKLIRLHSELDINLEGIGAIAHLLEKIGKMQEEMTVLKNKLRRYELG